MYILTEKENNNLNFYSESGDGVKLFEDLGVFQNRLNLVDTLPREQFSQLLFK